MVYRINSDDQLVGMNYESDLEGFGGPDAIAKEAKRRTATATTLRVVAEANRLHDQGKDIEAVERLRESNHAP